MLKLHLGCGDPCLELLDMKEDGQAELARPRVLKPCLSINFWLAKVFVCLWLRAYPVSYPLVCCPLSKFQSPVPLQKPKQPKQFNALFGLPYGSGLQLAAYFDYIVGYSVTQHLRLISGVLGPGHRLPELRRNSHPGLLLGDIGA